MLCYWVSQHPSISYKVTELRDSIRFAVRISLIFLPLPVGNSGGKQGRYVLTKTKISASHYPWIVVVKERPWVLSCSLSRLIFQLLQASELAILLVYRDGCSHHPNITHSFTDCSFSPTKMPVKLKFGMMVLHDDDGHVMTKVRNFHHRSRLVCSFSL